MLAEGKLFRDRQTMVSLSTLVSKKDAGDLVWTISSWLVPLLQDN